MSEDDAAAAERAARAFADRFGAPPEGVWAAPGRVNVIGEHTDYNGGFVLPVALPHTTRAALGRRGDGRVALASLQQPDEPAELTLAELAPGLPPGWGGYAAGVVAGLREPVAAAGGVNVLVDGDVPAGAGLSSSAALECAVALGLRDLLDLDLTREDLVDLARRAENDYVGAPTGILDQSAALLCRAGRALFLDTRDRSAEQVPFDLAAAGLALLVIDTCETYPPPDWAYPCCGRSTTSRSWPRWTTAPPRAPSCCAGRGTSSPRTPASSRWWRPCGPVPTRARSGRC